MPKYGNIGHFHLGFFLGGGLKLVWKILKKKLKFGEDIAPCVYFLQKKKLKWHYFIFNPENLL